MSRHLTASTPDAAAIQSILAASQNGGGSLDPCSLGRDHLPQGRRVQYLKVPNVSIGHFRIYHNNLFLSLQNLHEQCCQFLLGLKTNWKQCLCKILEGQKKKTIMINSKMAYWNNVMGWGGGWVRPKYTVYTKCVGNVMPALNFM